MVVRSDVISYPGRRLIVLTLFVLGFALLAVRAFQLQVLEREFLQEKGDARRTRVIDIQTHRGMITDRHGDPIAISTPVDSIWVNPQEAQGITPESLAALSRLLNVKQEMIRHRIESKMDKEFVYLKRHISPEIAERVMSLKIAGIDVQREYRRYYPAGEVFSHVIGFTNIDDQGQEGVELAFNDWLSGEPGAKRVVRDRMGRAVEDIGLIRPAKPGNDLKLSIDGRIQYLAYRELLATIKENNAVSGSVVVMDPNTGEILAMVNQPGFNPNNRNELRGERYRNRAVKDLFEPGSTAKPFTVAAALETGRYFPSTQIDTTPGYFRVHGYPIRDSRNLGVIDLTTLISKSSNVGASKLAMDIPREQLWDVFQKLGFGQVTGSGFPGEAGGVLRDYTQWYPLDQATLAFGYGLSVTPLQLAVAYSVLAADGVYRTPTFLASEEKPSATPVISPQTARAVRQMMQGVVEPKGTGYRAAVEGYHVAGKTGTAKKAIAGGYAKKRYISVFAGMVPINAPRLVAVVVVNEPRAGEYYGGKVAAPAFSAIMSGALRQLNVVPDALPEHSLPFVGGAV